MPDKNNGDGDRVCGTCGYCTDLKDPKTGIVDSEQGICRRYPPQIIVMTIKSKTVMPDGKPAPSFQMAQGMRPHVAFAMPACGEWQAKQS